MKKFILRFLILITLTALFAFSANAAVNTDIRLDSQTIREKEYENEGITGIYDVDMFESADENVFKQKKEERSSSLARLQDSLFVKNISINDDKTVSEKADELKLFSSVKYYINDADYEKQDDSSLYLSYALLISAAAVVGFLGARIFFKIKAKKEA